MSDDMTDFEKFYNICEELWNTAIKFERERCAKILNDRAKKCAEKADIAYDEKDRVDLLATAWTFSVIEQEIIEGDGNE